MTPPRLDRPTFQTRKGPRGEEARTVTRTAPHRPVSKWHRAVWWLHHHLSREVDGTWLDQHGWSGQRSTVARRRKGRADGLDRETLRSDQRIARHAQDLREEAETKGGKEERARFYGTGEHSGAHHRGESRQTVTKAERELRRHEEAERDRAEHPWFRPRGKAARS